MKAYDLRVIETGRKTGVRTSKEGRYSRRSDIGTAIGSRRTTTTDQSHYSTNMVRRALDGQMALQALAKSFSTAPILLYQLL